MAQTAGYFYRLVDQLFAPCPPHWLVSTHLLRSYHDLWQHHSCLCCVSFLYSVSCPWFFSWLFNPVSFGGNPMNRSTKRSRTGNSRRKGWQVRVGMAMKARKELGRGCPSPSSRTTVFRRHICGRDHHDSNLPAPSPIRCRPLLFRLFIMNCLEHIQSLPVLSPQWQPSVSHGPY